MSHRLGLVVLVLYTLSLVLMLLISTPSIAADTNTVSSTVVTDKTPPTASAPSVVINNSDVCKSAFSASAQTGFVGLASGITVTDEDCIRLKLARSLYGMGMKIAAISLLCQKASVFDAMIFSGTPCPYKGKIANDAKKLWYANYEDIPQGSIVRRQIIAQKEKQEEKNRKPWVVENLYNYPDND